MSRNIARQITQAWCILVLLTVLSLATSHSGLSRLVVNGLILAAAFAKGRWMLMDFLKLRSVPSDWQVMFLCWLGLITLIAWGTTALPVPRS